MSTYALVQRGQIQVVGPDATGQKDFTLPSPVKLGSSFLTGTVRATPRKPLAVQRADVAITDASANPLDVALASAIVDLTQAYVVATLRENRAGNPRGATVKIQDANNVRIQWPGALGVGETIDVNYQVVEGKPAPVQATLRLVNATTVRLEWDGTVATGETLTAQFEVFDYENAGDDQKEVLFRLQRILGYLGENTIQDLITYGDSGQMTSYRMRVFDTQANAEAATIDLPDASPLQTGEAARVTVTQDIHLTKNDRLSALMVRDELLSPTPGVD